MILWVSKYSGTDARKCLKKIMKNYTNELDLLALGYSGAGPYPQTFFDTKKELKEIRSDIGMIFQTFNLVNRSSVLKNVLTGRLSQVSTLRSVLGLRPKEDKDIAFESLNKVEILEKDLCFVYKKKFRCLIF